VISVFFEDTEVLDLCPDFFLSWLSKVVSLELLELGDLNLIFTSDDYLLGLNRKHLNHDFFTDIITFDYCVANCVSGDLFISKDMLIFNSKRLSVPFLTELHRVVAHGVLHMCGYDDKTPNDKLVMRKKEDEALALIVSCET
jgi:rRNA maturation RNase YbeY